MKIKYTFIILFLNLIMISCQSASEQVKLDILHEPKSVFNNKAYPLRYHHYTADIHSRIVLQETQIQEKWQSFKEYKIDYMDVYFNKEKIIGYKGYLPIGSDGNKIYKSLLKKVSEDKDYHPVELKNNDQDILMNEWESKEIILGLKYENNGRNIALIVVNKNELPYFYDQVFYDEFLNLTKFRSPTKQIHLKELKGSPSGNDKSFYKEKFKDLKKEYEKK
ncbi:hypothetical protein [Chryseobacterium bernardetii]|uniref:hypothetical protein n=1 Tax=Chryseobacterium bernardetii TaxID=1241978 RepID=UPI003AF41120